jgi:hypothetical protein
MKKGLTIGIVIGVSIFVIILAIILISSPKSDVKDVVITPVTNVTTNVQIMNNQTLNVETEIQKKLDEIEKINLENEYSPKEREWQTSGPFQIDRKQYAIGEKIFLIIGGLNADEKGQIAVMRTLNATHYSVYLSIPFDGAAKPEFNYYLEPKLSKASGICSVDDIVGKWAIIFRGTDYPNLYFEITKDGVVPGTDIESVC